MPVNPRRQTYCTKWAQKRGYDCVRNNSNERRPRRFVWIDVISAPFLIMDYISRIPPILVDGERAIFDKRADLIESRRLIVLG